MRPERTASIPTSARRKLDLPTPLRPSRQVISPLRAVKLTSRNVWLAP